MSIRKHKHKLSSSTNKHTHTNTPTLLYFTSQFSIDSLLPFYLLFVWIPFSPSPPSPFFVVLYFLHCFQLCFLVCLLWFCYEVWLREKGYKRGQEGGDAETTPNRKENKICSQYKKMKWTIFVVSFQNTSIQFSNAQQKQEFLSSFFVLFSYVCIWKKQHSSNQQEKNTFRVFNNKERKQKKKSFSFPLTIVRFLSLFLLEKKPSQSVPTDATQSSHNLEGRKWRRGRERKREKNDNRA